MEAQGTPEWVTYTFLGVCLIAVHVALMFLLLPELFSGTLPDPDSYTRLLRVAQLAETGSWYDNVLERMNAPYGLDFHWTRPLDLILLVGSLPLAPVLGFEAALYWSGVLISPVLHIVSCLCLAWAVKPLFGARRSALSIIVLLAQPIITAYALAGRADHHMLLVLAYTVSLGLFLRLVARPDPGWVAFACGATAGFGLWSSIEFLLPLVSLFAALTVLWLAGLPGMARKAALFSGGLVVVVLFGVLAEHPVTSLASPEYDRLSAPHLLLALVGLAFWASASGLRRRRTFWSTPSGRFSFLAMAGVVLGGIVALTYPGVFSNPVTADPEFWALYGRHFAEYQSFLDRGAAGVGFLLVYLGGASLALPYGVWMVLPKHDSNARAMWIPISIGLMTFVPLAVLHLRFAVWAGVVVAISLTGLLLRVNETLGSVEGPLRRAALRVSLDALILTGFMLLGVGVLGLSGEGSSASGSREEPGCSVAALAGVLEEGRVGEAPRTLLANGNIGPELVYRTHHSVVAAPYHRNAGGILETHRIMTSTDPDYSREILERRGVDLVVVCPPSDDGFFGENPSVGETLYNRMVEDRPPPWLRALDNPGSRESGFLIYEVVEG